MAVGVAVGVWNVGKESFCDSIWDTFIKIVLKSLLCAVQCFCKCYPVSNLLSTIPCISLAWQRGETVETQNPAQAMALFIDMYFL